jgi:menaquinone-9 beta-reductase
MTAEFYKEGVAIIGGGPVGLFLAIKFSLKNIPVDLYEKKSWPIDKTCGQGVMPRGILLLRGIGIDTDSIGYPFSGITFIDDGTHLRGRVKGNSRGIKRKDLSLCLYNKCKENHLISLFNEEVSVVDNGKSVLLTREDGKNYHYDKIYCCDGMFSPSRLKLKQDKLSFGAKILGRRMGARFHVPISSWSKNVEVYWKDGIECYVTPVSNDEVELAFIWYQDRYSHSYVKNNLNNLFPEVFNHFPDFSIDDYMASGPFSLRSKSLFFKNVTFVGDSYCFIDGITGEGLSIGFYSADLLVNGYNTRRFLLKLKITSIYFKYSFFVYLLLLISRCKSFRRIIFKLVGRSKLFSAIINSSRV